MTKVLDEKSRQAVAAAVRYYRELGIYDLYRREPPEGVSFGLPLEREAMAVAEPNVPAQAQLQGLDGEPVDEAPVHAAPAPAANAAQIARILADKPAALRVIREEIGDCTRCELSRQRTNIVFGVGTPEARIMFVGEGPGADEDAKGEPFVGRAGQLLNNMIQAMGIRREDVYIANVVKCRPPQNRAPEREESDVCGRFLMRQIAVVRPEVVVALGATAARYLMGRADSMINLRGRIYDFHPIVPQSAPERDPEWTTKLVITYHPAFLLRDPRQKKEAWQDLQMVMRYLGMALPQRSGGE
jgi:DNA polymerase